MDRAIAPVVAVSACLLGSPVRYDGASKPHLSVLAQLEPEVQWLPLCPEVVAGWGIPRPPVALEGTAHAPRVVGVVDRIDRTASLERACAALADQLLAAGVVAAVLKARSPSCGRAHQLPDKTQADGRLVAALLARAPWLTVHDEHTLAAPGAAADMLATIRRASRGSPRA